MLGPIDEILGKLGQLATGGGGGIGGMHSPDELSGRASGGPVLAGQSYVVGEDHPEILTMGNTSGYITSRAPGGGGQVVNVYVAGSILSERDLIATINKATGKGTR